MSWCSVAEELYIEVQHSDVSTKCEMSTMDVVLKTQDGRHSCFCRPSFGTLLVECFWFDIMIVLEQSKQQLRAQHTHSVHISLKHALDCIVHLSVFFSKCTALWQFISRYSIRV